MDKAIDAEFATETDTDTESTGLPSEQEKEVYFLFVTHHSRLRNIAKNAQSA